MSGAWGGGGREGNPRARGLCWHESPAGSMVKRRPPESAGAAQRAGHRPLASASRVVYMTGVDMRNIHQARAWFAAGGLAVLLMHPACAAGPSPAPRGAQAPATNAPTAVATIELDVPVVEPVPPLEHGVSKTGRQHNSNCRYWKTVVAPVDPARSPTRCKVCGG